MSARERNRAAGRIGRPVTALAVAILFLGTTSPVLAAEKIGSTSLVIRRVTGEMEEKLRLLSLRDDVHRDELITTATESASRIRFVDGTELELGPEAQLKLDRFVYDDDPARGQFILSAARGVFRFISGKLAKEAYAVNTPTVTIGVRGTTFACIVGKDGTTAVILESEDGVVVRHRSGEQLTLRELGLAIVAYPDGRLTEPGPPPDWAVERLKQLDALLGFRPVRVERDRDE
ncbi:MAG: FecR domain-containing protein, partial [Alphaproteobacteria bacterium]